MNLFRSYEKKRQFLRIPTFYLVRYKKSASADPRDSRLINVKNISGGGLLMTTHEPLKPSAHIEVEINLPGQKKPIVARAKVIRCRRIAGTSHYRAGVSFIHIDPQDRADILAHVARIQKASHSPKPRK